jgi:hypothetical protein
MGIRVGKDLIGTNTENKSTHSIENNINIISSELSKLVWKVDDVFISHDRVKRKFQISYSHDQTSLSKIETSVF